MTNKNQLDRGGEDFSHLYNLYLRKGASALTDVEARAISIGSGGASLVPASWTKFVQETIKEDAIMGKVNVINTTTTFSQPIVSAVPSVNTNVSEASLGTEDSTMALASSKFVATAATYSLKKVTSWLRVSTELLEDSEAAQSIEELLKRQLIAKLITTINDQILVGSGSGACQGSVTAATNYSRSAIFGGSGGSQVILNIFRAIMNDGGANVPKITYANFRRSLLVMNTYAPINFTSEGVFWQALAFDDSFHGLPVLWHPLDSTGVATSGSIQMHFFDPTQYMLALNFGGFNVTRYDEAYAGTGQTAFVASVRASGNIMNTQGVLNLLRA
jgi:hypothetical protein